MLVLAGVGRVTAGVPLSEEALRRAAGSAVRQLAGTETVALALPAATVADAAAVAEGALFGAYSYSEHRTDKGTMPKDPVRSIVIVTPLQTKRHWSRRWNGRGSWAGPSTPPVRW